MAISTRQRCHYWAMAEQEAARTRAIRALVHLAQFPDDNEAAVRSLRLLAAVPSEIEAPLTAPAAGSCPPRVLS